MRSEFNDHVSGLSPIPPNLQTLTLRTAVIVGDTPRGNMSYLPATAEIINLFIPSLQHLILDIDIDISHVYSNLAKVDFSPLAVLGTAVLSIPRIDLYVHTDILPSHVTLAQVLSSLRDITRSIEEGVVIVHSEERLAKLYTDCPLYLFDTS